MPSFVFEFVSADYVGGSGMRTPIKMISILIYTACDKV